MTGRSPVPSKGADARRRPGLTDTDRALESALRELLEATSAGASVCPSQAARAVSPDAWRPLMPDVRSAARRLVTSGEAEITQGGHVVDPSTARGPIRVRPTRSGWRNNLEHLGAAADMTDSVKTPEKIVYTARATSVGARSGHTTSDDGILDLTLTAPKETGGPGTGTNPEQLFAAGYSACFQSALGLVAKKQGVDTKDSRVTAEIGFGPEGESFGITAELKVAIPGVDLAKVQELADAAHQVCPYSKATRGNIPVTITAVES